MTPDEVRQAIEGARQFQPTRFGKPVFDTEYSQRFLLAFLAERELARMEGEATSCTCPKEWRDVGRVSELCPVHGAIP